MKWIWVIAILMLSGGVAAANSLELSLNDRSVQVGYRYFLTEDDYGRSVLGARLLYNEKEETRLGSLGLGFIGAPGNVPGLDLGVGVRLYGGRTDPDQDLLVAAVGASVEYAPPVLGGIGFSTELFYGPKILSFLDAERLLEAGVTVGYAITPRVRIHVGYQNIRASFEKTNTWTIDEAVRLGFTSRF